MGGIEYDLLVIGGGAAGRAGAVAAATRGLRVALVEERPEPGGWAAEVGVARRLLSDAAVMIEDAMKNPVLSVGVKGGISLADLMRRRGEAIDRLRAAAARELDRYHVHRVTGRGEFAGTGTVAVGERRLAGRAILAATGSAVERVAGMMDQESVLETEHLPRSMRILGSGDESRELARIFAAFGVAVVEGAQAEVTVRVAPRTGRTARIGLEAVGAKVDDRGFLIVDELGRAADGIWAAGDVTGVRKDPAGQARAAVQQMFGGASRGGHSNL